MGGEAQQARHSGGAAGDGRPRGVRSAATSTTATPTRSGSSRCASASGTTATTPAIRTSPSCSSSGSSTRRRRSSSSGSPAGRAGRRSRRLRRVDRRRGAPGASSTAGATSCASTRRAACSRQSAGQRQDGGGGQGAGASWTPSAATAGDSAGPRALAAVADGQEVPRDAVPVGRLDSADGLRLLRPRAVGLRQGRHPDPAHLGAADTRLERPAGGPRAPDPGRPRLLPRLRRRRPPRRDLARRRQVHQRPAHGRRRQGREPEGALLRAAVRRRAPVRPGRRARRRCCRRGTAARRAIRRRSRMPRRRSPEMPPRSQRPGTLLFEAVKAQELRKARLRDALVLFLVVARIVGPRVADAGVALRLGACSGWRSRALGGALPCWSALPAPAGW